MVRAAPLTLLVTGAARATLAASGFDCGEISGPTPRQVATPKYSGRDFRVPLDKDDLSALALAAEELGQPLVIGGLDEWVGMTVR